MRAKRLVKMKKIRENFLRFVIAVIFGDGKHKNGFYYCTFL